MNRALGLSAFVLALATPFVDFIYVGALGIAAFAALIIWGFSPARERLRAQEIDEAQLQCELSEFVRQINAEDGK